MSMNDGGATNSQPSETSERKAASNRRNSRKSTGPRTARGKSRSRLNALKHGVLASQAVIATCEGRAERRAFEELVEGFALDFCPVGTFEQVLVQQIAACVWRQGRLLRFENRAAFQSRDNRTVREMNQALHGRPPIYVFKGKQMEGIDILDEAGLGLDLPSERDTIRLIRYETTITRSLKAALAQLKAQQQARRAGAGETANIAPAYADREVVVDAQALRRNRGPEAGRLAAKVSEVVHALREREEDEERLRRREAEEAAEAAEQAEPVKADPAPAQAGDAAAARSENYQTKPNTLEHPDAVARHERMIQSAEAILKVSASLEPKRPPSGD